MILTCACFFVAIFALKCICILIRATIFKFIYILDFSFEFIVIVFLSLHLLPIFSARRTKPVFIFLFKRLRKRLIHINSFFYKVYKKMIAFLMNHDYKQSKVIHKNNASQGCCTLSVIFDSSIIKKSLFQTIKTFKTMPMSSNFSKRTTDGAPKRTTDGATLLY